MGDRWPGVREEHERFGRALPRLMERIPGRWVVFKDGRVQSDHATQNEALMAALRAYGLDGGYLIVRVELPLACPQGWDDDDVLKNEVAG